MLTQKIPYAIRIFHTNDIHSRVQSNDYNQGLELEFHPVFYAATRYLFHLFFIGAVFLLAFCQSVPFHILIRIAGTPAGKGRQHENIMEGQDRFPDRCTNSSRVLLGKIFSFFGRAAGSHGHC